MIAHIGYLPAAGLAAYVGYKAGWRRRKVQEPKIGPMPDVVSADEYREAVTASFEMGRLVQAKVDQQKLDQYKDILGSGLVPAPEDDK